MVELNKVGDGEARDLRLDLGGALLAEDVAARLDALLDNKEVLLEAFRGQKRNYLEDDVCIDALALDRVREADDGRLRHGWVLGQRALHLSRAKPNESINYLTLNTLNWLDYLCPVTLMTSSILPVI